MNQSALLDRQERAIILRFLQESSIFIRKVFLIQKKSINFAAQKWKRSSFPPHFSTIKVGSVAQLDRAAAF